MRAAVCVRPGSGHVELQQRQPEHPGPGQLLLRVHACGVCRTDLHVVDGELAAKAPVVPGHEIVGSVVEVGAGADGFAVGERVGVPWLASTCGRCEYCRSGRENLCALAQFTGCTVDGGYAEQYVAEAAACLRLPERYGDVEAAPLLCAGLIGYRAFRMAGPVRRLGLYGFGAAAHLLAQLAVHQGIAVSAITRPGDERRQRFARALGCAFAGEAESVVDGALDAAILFAPVGALVPAALRAVAPGGTVVCAGIHMSDIPSFPYRWLWQERRLVSVANLTRRDGADYMQLAASMPLRVHARRYPLAAADRALDDLRAGRIDGAAVLQP